MAEAESTAAPLRLREEVSPSSTAQPLPPPPDLCEVWNVEGDLLALARLWKSLLDEGCQDSLSELKKKLEGMDPEDFVMITSRGKPFGVLSMSLVGSVSSAHVHVKSTGAETATLEYLCAYARQRATKKEATAIEIDVWADVGLSGTLKKGK